MLIFCKLIYLRFGISSDHLKHSVAQVSPGTWETFLSENITMVSTKLVTKSY